MAAYVFCYFDVASNNDTFVKLYLPFASILSFCLPHVSH